MKKRFLWLVIFVLCCFYARTQDLHFSQFFFSPQGLNPAHVGDFNGSYRINANQKTQWKQVSRPYMTFALTGDAAFDFIPQQMALGLAVINDNAGDARFNTFQILTAASYSFELDAEAKNTLRLGLQLGPGQISINENYMSFNNQYNGVVYDPTLPSGEAFPRNSRWYFNLHAGAAHRFNYAERKNITTGMAVHNLSQPNQSFFNDTGVELPMRFSIYSFASWMIHPDFDVMPAIRWMGQGTYQEFIAGSAIRYILMDEGSIYRSVFGGYFGRFGDSGIAMIGLEYDAWRVALSYDINVSDLKPASRNRGGFEFSVQYIFGESQGKPGVRHKYCPVFL